MSGTRSRQERVLAVKAGREDGVADYRAGRNTPPELTGRSERFIRLYRKAYVQAQYEQRRGLYFRPDGRFKNGEGA